MPGSTVESHYDLTSFVPYGIFVMLCAGYLALTAGVSRHESLTFDETFYLNCALETVQNRSLSPDICGQGVAPLPLILTYVPPLLGTSIEPQANKWVGHLSDPQMIVWPRFLNALLFGVPLLWICFEWGRRRHGWPAGLVTAGLLALSPIMISHGSLATMDLGFALTGVVAILVTGWMLRHPTKSRLAIAALAAALALSSKYSAIFLVPGVAILLLLSTPDTNGEQPLPILRVAGWKLATQRFLVWLAILIPCWWGAHLFSFTGPLKNFPMEMTSSDSPWYSILGRGPWAIWFMELAHERLDRPAPLSGIVFQYLHNKAGHHSFLLGESSQFGWWYYFPCVFAFKSTPVELGLTGVVLAAMAVRIRHPVQAWRRMDPALKTMLVSTVIFVGLLLTAKINLGQRYLMLLYPLIVMVGVDCLVSCLALRKRWLCVLAALMLGGQCASCLSVYPHELTYFNRICGGPENGVNLLSDSNLDWGQGLVELKHLADRKELGDIAFSYYGTAMPEAYGLQTADLKKLPLPVEEYDTLALSMTHFQFGAVGGGCYAEEWLRHPDDVAGNSIYLYRLNTSDRREGFRRMIECRKQNRMPGTAGSINFLGD